MNTSQPVKPTAATTAVVPNTRGRTPERWSIARRAAHEDPALVQALEHDEAAEQRRDERDEADERARSRGCP